MRLFGCILPAGSRFGTRPGLASIGWDEGLHPDFGTTYQGRPNGIPYVFVDDSQPHVPVFFYAYRDESDPGPYPIPPDAPIEGGDFGRGDRHVLVLDEDDCVLYELYAAYRFREGALWLAASGTRSDLTSNEFRPDGWTSADAAGLPIYPGLVRYDEVVEEGSRRQDPKGRGVAAMPPSRCLVDRSADPESSGRPTTACLVCRERPENGRRTAGLPSCSGP